jgi:hypothetical protein
MHLKPSHARSLFALSSFLLVPLVLGGCGEPLPGEELETVRGAVFAIPSSFNFSRNGVSVTEPRQSEAETDVGMRAGHGGDPLALVAYTTILANDGRKPWRRIAAPSLRVTERPSRNWMVPPNGGPSMNFIGTDVTNSLARDTFLGAVFPSATARGLRPVGPIAALASDTSRTTDAARSANTATALMSDSSGNLSMYHAYLPTDQWADLLMPIGAGPAACGAGKTPYSSPQAIRRRASLDFALNMDSIVYGCGSASPAQLCEYRKGGKGHGSTYTACFGSGSSFAPGTRPVAFADGGSFSSVPGFGTGERWFFATIKTGTQLKVVALRETSAIDPVDANGQPTQPTYSALKVIDTQADTSIISTPMPVMYKDQNNVTTLSVFYLRAVGASGLTFLMESKTTDFNTFSAPIEILDSRVRIAAAMEPSPHYQVGQPGVIDQLRVQFRLPVNNSTIEVRDTVEMIRQPDGKYVKTILPAPSDSTNLYMMQQSTASLYQVDEGTGARTAVGGGWSGVTAFTTDGVGLGYVVKGADLIEVNLNDNVSRRIGTESWTGTTALAFGYHQSFGAGKDSYPRLWAAKGNAIRRVDLATGVSTSIATFASGIKMIATYSDPTATILQPTLYVIDGNGTLNFVNTLLGTVSPIGTAGQWTQAVAMTTNSTSKYVYIAAGPAGAGAHRLYRLDQGGAVLGQSSGFSNAQWLATVAGTTYLLKSRHLNRIGGTGGNVNLHSFGGQIWDYSETGMAGRNF